MQQQHQHYYVARRKRYGFHNFAFDFLMICCTGGAWLIWMFVREMRGR